MLIDSLIAKKVWVKSYVTGQIALLPKPMIMKGTIATAGDFPTTADVLNGWVYKVTANVTDNNPAKTNTGLSFLAGDEICWIEELDTWVDLGSDALFVRDGDTLSPANANDNLDLGSGDFITTGDVDAGTHSELTLAPQANGFTIAGGTTSKTLTVPLDASVSGTNTGDQDLSGLVPYTGATGAVDLGTNTLSSGGLTTKGDANLYSNSTDALTKDIKLFKSRGTFASPSAILTSDYLGEIVALGHDGSVTDYGHGAGYVRSASIRFRSLGTVGTNRVPSYIEFYTSTNAAPSIETLAGNIDFNGTFSWLKSIETASTLMSYRNNLTTTSTDGLLALSLSASLIGTPVQMSPRIRERGSAWNTTSSASETVDCIQELLPVSGTSVSGTYRIGFSINGGAYSYPFTFTSGGSLRSTNIELTNTLYFGSTLENRISSIYLRITAGSATIPAEWSRNTADAYATAVFNNANASSTGNITNFQWQSVNKAFVDRFGVFASYGNDLPHIVKKAASANVRNSHNAEATSTSAAYVKVKTITLTYGLVGIARFLFDLKTSDAGTPTPAYGRIYRNGVALGTEQSDVTGAYVTKSEDITQNWNPGDTVELWVKIAGGNTVSVQNFRIAYDDAPSITVASVNS